MTSQIDGYRGPNSSIWNSLPPLGPTVSEEMVHCVLFEPSTLYKVVVATLANLRKRGARDANHQDAEDALSDFCARALPGVVRNYKAGSHFWPYFATSLLNHCSMLAKKGLKRPREISINDVGQQTALADVAVARQEATESQTRRNLLLEELPRAIARLPEQQRKVMELRHQGIKEEEIAVRLDLTLTNVKQLALRARARLRSDAALVSKVAAGLSVAKISDWPGLCRMLGTVQSQLPRRVQRIILGSSDRQLSDSEKESVLDFINAVLNGSISDAGVAQDIRSVSTSRPGNRQRSAATQTPQLTFFFMLDVLSPRLSSSND